MKLAQLIPHTSASLGIPPAQVKTVARVLQPAGLISIGGRGPGGVELTVDDKINLLIGVCGVEVSNRAADSVREWRQAIRWGKPDHPEDFAFLRATNVKDLIVDLITKDLSGGPLTAWLQASRDDLDRASGKPVPGIRTHDITLDFFVDEIALELRVSRNIHHDYVDPRKLPFSLNLPQVASDTVCVRFVPRLPPHDAVPKPKAIAPSRLIRRLNETNLIGWGECLTQ